MSKFQVSWRKSLAELVTIVVGVLIALMANDWRDAARDRVEAGVYGARLDQALASDLEEYARAAEWADAVDSAAVEVLSAYRRGEVPAEDGKRLIEAVLRASWMIPPSVSRDTYDDLVSTGSLALLPVAVRDEVGAYYRQAQLYTDREEIFKEILARGYWRVPAVVLGPDLLPKLWKAIASTPQGQQQEGDTLTVTTARLNDVLTRLRRISDLETQLADVRHVMVQREEIYAVRMPTAAQRLRQVLAGAK